jgi:hypothetical protein
MKWQSYIDAAQADRKLAIARAELPSMIRYCFILLALGTSRFQPHLFCNESLESPDATGRVVCGKCCFNDNARIAVGHWLHVLCGGMSSLNCAGRSGRVQAVQISGFSCAIHHVDEACRGLPDFITVSCPYL